MTTTTTTKNSSSSSENQKPAYVIGTENFFKNSGIFSNFPESSSTKDSFSQLIRALLTVDRLDRGRVTVSFTVTPVISNAFNTLHGGLVAAVADAVGEACAKTAVGDKELFLGESTTSYLSAAKMDDVVEVDGSILRQGRSVVVTSMEFRIKKTRKLFYTSRATFYVMPAASL